MPTATNWAQAILAAGAVISPLVVLVGVVWTNLNTKSAVEEGTNNAQRQIEAASKVAEEARAAASLIAQDQIEAAAENSRRQAHSSVVSSGRLRWIDAIRDDLADLLALHRTHFLTVSAMKIAKGNDFKDLQTSRVNLEEKLEVLNYRIKLRLTEGKPKHDTLMSAVTDVIYMTGDSINYTIYDNAIRAGRDLFYSEWKRLRFELLGEIPSTDFDPEPTINEPSLEADSTSKGPK